MSFNSQQANFAIGYKPQTALQTTNVAGDMWKLSRLNAGFNKFGMTMESDAAESGKATLVEIWSSVQADCMAFSFSSS